MRITMVYGARNDGQVNITRVLDGRRKRLIISCPSQMSPADVLRAAMRQLTDDEALELAEALGVKSRPPADQAARQEEIAKIDAALAQLHKDEDR